MCAYSYSQDKLRQDDEWQKKLSELTGEEKNPENIELIEHDWRNHDAKRIYKKDSFDFFTWYPGILVYYLVLLPKLYIHYPSNGIFIIISTSTIVRRNHFFS